MTPEELSQALVQPSATIAPGYAMASAILKNGTTVRGFIRNEGNHALPLQDLTGRLVVVDKDAAKITREPGSPMPPLKASPEEQTNLIAYLHQLTNLGASSLSADLSTVARKRDRCGECKRRESGCGGLQRDSEAEAG